MHINALELLAIKFALQSFENDVTGQHVKLTCDNTCAVAYTKHLGGSQSQICNEIAQSIWFWCRERNVSLAITHISGKLNVEADEMSRKFSDDTEWQLNPNIFKRLIQKTGIADIDLFASCLNCQLRPFISWKPDPEAMAIDAFTVPWNWWTYVYIFPPFNQIQQAIGKL